MEILTSLFLIGIVLIGLIPILALFENKISFIEFPVPFALTILGWFLPQLIAEVLYGHVPPDAILEATFMAFLCFSSTMIGYFYYKPELKFSIKTGNLAKLENYILFFCLVLSIPFCLLVKMGSAAFQGHMTGTPVLLVFFSTGIHYAFFYALLLWLGGEKNKKVFFTLIVGCAVYLVLVIYGGRRSDSMEVFFGIVGGLYFLKNKRIPRMFILAAGLLFAMFVPNTGAYRNAVLSNGSNKLQALFEVDWLGNFENVFNKPGGEVENFIVGLYSVEQTWNFDYGLSTWNSFVNRFVPGHLLGFSLKNSLKANISKAADDAQKYGHEMIDGQTFTGMFTAFSSFWYFGCLEFLAIGMFYKYFYLRAKIGLLSAQATYLYMITSGLHSITHTSDWFFFAFIQLLIFTWPYKKYGMILWPPKPLTNK